MAEPSAFKYRAFISYSHADTSWAKWLQRGIEGFCIDKDLVGRETPTGTIPKALLPIFRDRSDFTAGHTLTEQTRAALDDSQALIVICSPAAAKSRYVNEEVRLFKSRHPERPVVPLIVAGNPGDPELECFPPSLKFKLAAEGHITEEPIEVLAADAREEADGKTLALAKVVAGLLGVSSDDVFRRAERERRRKGRVRNGIIAVLAILLVVASGSAVYAWQQLKTNEAFLNATLETATEIVNTAVTQAEKYGVPRTATLEMLAGAERLFEDMARLGRATPELKHRKAMMLIEFAHNYAILGDTAKQRARAEEAHRLMVELATATPDDPETLLTLAAAYEAKGNVLVAQGNLVEALKSFRESLAIASRLAKADPDHLGRQLDLSFSYIRMGEVLAAQGNLADALKSYRDGLAIADSLVAADPSNAGWQRERYISHIRVGDVLKAQGDLAEALKLYRGALAIAEQLAKAGPSNADWQRNLSVAYAEVGDVLTAQGNLGEALKSYLDSHAIADQLAKSDPTNAGWQRDLSLSHGKIGDVLEAQGNLTAALERYRATRDSLGHLTETDPNNARWQYDLGISNERVGNVLKAQGDLAGALGAYETRQAIISRLAKTDPSNARWQSDLALSYIKVGEVLMVQGNLAEALKSFQESLAIRQRVAKADPANALRQRDLALSHGNVAAALAQQGETDQAVAEYRKARAIVARLKEQSPDDVALANDFAWYDAKISELSALGNEPRVSQPEQAAQ